MGADCHRTECDESCIAPSPSIGRAHQLARFVLVAATAVGGAVAVLTCAAIPGSNRVRRGSWALQQVSRCLVRALGVRTVVRGRLRSGPTLVVGNHVSFLDVLVLSARAPMRMVAKHEVAGWPLVGRVASRAGALFVQRSRLRSLPDTVEEITRALRSGYRVQIFPEGTTRCGSALSPFRRAAFQSAINAAVAVTPVALSYRDSAGNRSAAVPFLGSETLLRCLLRVIATRDLCVEVRWLATIPGAQRSARPGEDRRVLAARAQSATAALLDVPVVGRVAPGPRVESAAASARSTPCTGQIGGIRYSPADHLPAISGPGDVHGAPGGFDRR